MDLSQLKPAKGATKSKKRIGRGQGSGNGKTAGRGQKGQKARSGGSVHPMFEGGQMPLIRRIPKRGFTNKNRVEYQVVNLRDLARVEGDVTPESLARAGLVGSSGRPVKILGVGDVEGARSVRAHAFSGTARTKIEAAGGSVVVIGAESAEATS